jgi:hypothetical protein
MTFYLRNGSKYSITNDEDVNVTDYLPAGTYTIFHSMKGFYLEKIEDMAVNGKIYGDVYKNVDRVETTFLDRGVNTGVFLSGEKGSGKTLLAKLIAKRFFEKNIPVLVVNTPYYGEEFNTFLGLIKQPCMVFFDEFEKTYIKKDEQNALLTLFDGSYNSHKLFIITCNDKWGISDFFRNRPGRFFYNFEYTGVDEAFIRDYCLDVLKDKSEIDRIVSFAETFTAFNFDILKAIVEEMNRYNEKLSEVLKFINATPTSDRHQFTVVEFIWKKPEFDIQDITGDDVYGGDDMNPYRDSFWVRIDAVEGNKDSNNEVSDLSEDESSSRDQYRYAHFSTDDLVGIKNGNFHYENSEAKLIMEKKKFKQFNYRNAF